MKARYLWPVLVAGLFVLIVVRAAQQTINIGANPNDATGDTLRTAFQKVNSNFTELYTATFTNIAVSAGNGMVRVTTNFHFATNAAYTIGQVPYANATNGIGFAGNLFWDNANGRFTVGTPAVAGPATLTVSGTNMAGGIYIGSGTMADGENMQLWNDGTDNFLTFGRSVGTRALTIGFAPTSGSTHFMKIRSSGVSDLVSSWRPLNVGPTKIMGTDSSTNMIGLVIGSGLSSDGVTLTATGGGSPGGSSTELQFRGGASTFGAATNWLYSTTSGWIQSPLEKGLLFANTDATAPGLIGMTSATFSGTRDDIFWLGNNLTNSPNLNVDFGKADSTLAAWRILMERRVNTGSGYDQSEFNLDWSDPGYTNITKRVMQVFARHDSNSIATYFAGNEFAVMPDVYPYTLPAWFYITNNLASLGHGSPDPNVQLDISSGTRNINQQLLIKNNRTNTHTGVVWTSLPNGAMVDDMAAAGIFAGPNTYTTGTSNSMAVYLSTNVPQFSVRWSSKGMNESAGTNFFTLSRSAGSFFVPVGVPDDAYDATSWNGSTNVPTKNAVRDKIEALSLGSSIFVNASSVSSPNFKDTTNILWTVTSATNVNAYVTNVSSSQIEDLTIITGDLASDAVTFAKMQNITTDRLLGRDTAGSGDTEELTVGGNLEFTGSGGIQRSALTGVVTASAGSGTTAFGTFASADLATALTDENGTGPFVLSTGPNLTNAVTVTSFQLVNATAPTTDASGEIAIDTNADGTTFTNPVVQFFASGNNHNLYPVEGTPTDGQIVSYQSSTKRLIFAADQTGGAGSVYVDAVSVSNPNFQSNTNFAFTVSAVTNINITSTNVGFLNKTNQTWTGTNNFTRQININTTNSTAIVMGDTNATPNTLTLTIPPAITTSYTLTFPATNGTTGQVLTNDGSGNMKWGAAGGTGTVTNRVGVYRTMWLDASAFIATTTNGATASTYAVAGTDNFSKDVWMFNDGQTNFVQIGMMMPDEWDLSTVKAKFFWTATSGSGNVVWQIAGGSVADDGALGALNGTYVTVTDALLASNDQHVSAATGAITVGNTPALGDFVWWTIKRDATHASDTFNATAQLFGVAIQYKETENEPVIW